MLDKMLHSLKAITVSYFPLLAYAYVHIASLLLENKRCRFGCMRKSRFCTPNFWLQHDNYNTCHIKKYIEDYDVQDVEMVSSVRWRSPGANISQSCITDIFFKSSYKLINHLQIKFIYGQTQTLNCKSQISQCLWQRIGCEWFS